MSVGGLTMGEDKARLYRRAVEDLIIAENESVLVCPSDGKPCLTPDRGCQAFAFGCMASDGEEEILWSCPRLKEGSS